jgi:hypothetical protein
MSLWTDQWTRKFLGLLFWIRLRGASQGCRNLLRTPARESGTGKEPRIRTVRQLAAAAGDGWLGSVGSPGQLETSLNSGYTVGPCNSYLEGPTPILWACCSRPLFGLAARASRARHPAPSSLFANGKAGSLITPPIVGRAISDARSFGVLHVPTRSQVCCSTSDPTLGASGSLGFRPDAPDVGNARARPLLARCTRCNVCSVTGTHVHAGSYTR